MNIEKEQMIINPDDTGDEWTGIVEKIKKELEGLTPEEIINKYIEAMAQSNAAGQRVFKGQEIEKSFLDGLENRKSALAILLPESRGRGITSEEINKKIKQRTSELLEEKN